MRGLPLALALLGGLAGCSGNIGDAGSESETGIVDQGLRWPHLCGGRKHAGCRHDEACLPLLSRACPGPDHVGLCVPRPRACPTVTAKVCGCDGVTYSNLCEAVRAGSGIVDHGACASSGPPCGGPNGACPGAGTCVGNAPHGTCECNAEESCKQGFVWNADPAVCACEVDDDPNPKDPCAGMTCKQGFECVEHADGTATCEPDGATPKP